MKRFLMIAFIASTAAAQTRIASDFEMQQMERQVAQSRDFLSQLSGHLNLGDLRLTRNETALARAEYSKALDIASNERLTARRASDLTRYSTATSYAALAAAKLGNPADAFALSEEAMRYSSDSAKSWNLYASAMSVIQKPAKAASASRNAVAIAARDGDRLDLAIYQYALASSLLELNQAAEAERLLTDVVTSLRSEAFAPLRREVARTESFEIYSTARGNPAAYISILNRSQLRLARLYEDRGDIARAREQYANALAARSDDPTALAAMARLGRTAEERERYYVQAFDANPFSLPLIRDYQRYLGGWRVAGGGWEGNTTGGEVRRTLQQMQSGELVAALATVDALLQKFPNNDTLQLLRREIEERRTAGPVVLRPEPVAADLRAIIAAFNENRLTPEQRTQLDRMTFTSEAIFNAGPPFETGTIFGVPFRFSEPMTFNGTFAAGVPLRLTYRILGATQLTGADALLLEPLRLEAVK
ncbi:MAG TPA: tetratricopeptide repeat protein [Thermoanaerobaculia bacterium]|nr:tetratricopeptide repeat protein [Thermoanaerobaculia bacterium]